MSEPDWSRYAPYFTRGEFECSCGCGRADMDPDYLDVILTIRKKLRAPMIVTSGFRCDMHPDEQDKLARGVVGDHAQGRGGDYVVAPQRRMVLVALAFNEGIRRFGMNWKGRGQFTHLGAGRNLPSPASWTY